MSSTQLSQGVGKCFAVSNRGLCSYIQMDNIRGIFVNQAVTRQKREIAVVYDYTTDIEIRVDWKVVCVCGRGGVVGVFGGGVGVRACVCVRLCVGEGSIFREPNCERKNLLNLGRG